MASGEVLGEQEQLTLANIDEMLRQMGLLALEQETLPV